MRTVLAWLLRASVLDEWGTAGREVETKQEKRDSRSLAAVSLGYLQPRAEEEMTVYWVSHKGD